MSDHFCTYFDHRYATKGLAMWRSLKKVCDSATLHILCLNEPCRKILSSLCLPDVYLYPLSALEDADPELRATRGSRSIVEYYFTVTPCLPLHIFTNHPDISRLTYVDADLFFFNNPAPVFAEVDDNAVGIIEHRFTDDLAGSEKHGRFNVGWLTFNRDPVAFECLNVWRTQCLEWCYDRVEPGRFAEQKYLDEWPSSFARVRIIQHKGANVAPWNLNRFPLSMRGNQLHVDDQILIFFHAHGFQPSSPGASRMLNLTDYHVEETPLLRQAIFDPYEEALLTATNEIAGPLALALLSDQPRHTVFLREALEASEADRSARLEAIHSLQRELEVTNADSAARLNAMRDLQRQLEVSQAERAARLAEIHQLHRQLAASEADHTARLAEIQDLQRENETNRRDQASHLETIAALRRQIGANERQSLESASTIQTLREQLAAAATDLGWTRARIHELEFSKTWRWTRAARWLASRFVGNSRG